MKAAGFRVWYDEGVIPATQWDENIARAIENCGYMMALISEPTYLTVPFARTLLSDPAILILDEATSSIDTQT